VIAPFLHLDSHPQIGSDYLLDVGGKLRRITRRHDLAIAIPLGWVFRWFLLTQATMNVHLHAYLAIMVLHVEYTLRLWCSLHLVQVTIPPPQIASRHRLTDRQRNNL
jgi:hypothetical protein